MSNLGFQYDWPHRSYPATRVSIPETITQLTQKAANLFQHLTKDSSKEYHGEAVIINYYKVRDYMTGHLDDGEEDQ
jgi:alkylated DNA repair dioxygenase AlkB